MAGRGSQSAGLNSNAAAHGHTALPDIRDDTDKYWQEADKILPKAFPMQKCRCLVSTAIAAQYAVPGLTEHGHQWYTEEFCIKSMQEAADDLEKSPFFRKAVCEEWGKVYTRTRLSEAATRLQELEKQLLRPHREGSALAEYLHPPYSSIIIKCREVTEPIIKVRTFCFISEF